MVEPTFTDSKLNFGGIGGLTIVPGQTFLTGAAGRLRSHAPGGVPVGKRSEVINGSKILIEACEYSQKFGRGSSGAQRRRCAQVRSPAFSRSNGAAVPAVPAGVSPAHARAWRRGRSSGRLA